MSQAPALDNCIDSTLSQIVVIVWPFAGFMIDSG